MSNFAYPLLGAITGDIAGSIYEFNNVDREFFPLFTDMSHMTDDSIMSLAISEALDRAHFSRSELLKILPSTIEKYANHYPYDGYGTLFRKWLKLPLDQKQPYNSYGNGALMRISPIIHYTNNLVDLMDIAYIVTSITHNHPKSYAAVMSYCDITHIIIKCANMGLTKSAIKDLVKQRLITYMNVHPEVDIDIDQPIKTLRETYTFTEDVSETWPVAVMAFLESENFADAIRLAIYAGGDSDTIACITGSLAALYYGIPVDIIALTRRYLDSLAKETFISAIKVEPKEWGE